MHSALALLALLTFHLSLVSSRLLLHPLTTYNEHTLLNEHSIVDFTSNTSTASTASTISPSKHTTVQNTTSGFSTLLTPSNISRITHRSTGNSTPQLHEMFGTSWSATLSYFYPITPSSLQTIGYKFGHMKNVHPTSIYECAPATELPMAPREYTCRRPNGAGATPESIRDIGVEFPRCDGHTGMMTEVLHWGAWEHNCWVMDKIPEGKDPADPKVKEMIDWNTKMLNARREVLEQYNKHIYTINCAIREVWGERERKVRELRGKKELWPAKKIEKAVREVEAQFWKDTWLLRERARLLDELVPKYWSDLVRDRKADFTWNGMGKA